jgi:hypothetical protein
LTNVLNERRSREEWVRLLHVLKLSQETNIKQLTTEPSAITPAKKRKPLIEDDIVLERGSPIPGLASSLSSDSDGASSEDMQPEERIGVISQQWDEVIANCDKTLDLLGSDPNNERVKGRSNYVYLLCFRCDLQG